MKRILFIASIFATSFAMADCLSGNCAGIQASLPMGGNQLNNISSVSEASEEDPSNLCDLILLNNVDLVNQRIRKVLSKIKGNPKLSDPDFYNSIKCEKGTHLLLWAVVAHRDEPFFTAVKALLKDQKVNPNVPDANGRTVLDLAVRRVKFYEKQLEDAQTEANRSSSNDMLDKWTKIRDQLINAGGKESGNA